MKTSDEDRCGHDSCPRDEVCVVVRLHKANATIERLTRERDAKHDTCDHRFDEAQKSLMGLTATAAAYRLALEGMVSQYGGDETCMSANEDAVEVLEANDAGKDLLFQFEVANKRVNELDLAHRAALATIERLTKEAERYKGGALTYDELVIACKNIGFDLKCGRCAGIFYTGGAMEAHDAGCSNASAEAERDALARERDQANHCTDIVAGKLREMEQAHQLLQEECAAAIDQALERDELFDRFEHEAIGVFSDLVSFLDFARAVDVSPAVIQAVKEQMQRFADARSALDAARGGQK